MAYLAKNCHACRAATHRCRADVLHNGAVRRSHLPETVVLPLVAWTRENQRYDRNDAAGEGAWVYLR